MENVDGNGGGRLVVTQLRHIKELVKQLDEHLGTCPDLCRRLASQISAVTEWSIGMIVSSSGNLKRSAGGAGLDSPPSLRLSATPSPLGGVSDVSFKANKKRKMMEKRKHQVRVSSAVGGVETVVDDGHSWRKYGQKDILGTKHPRGYYRCTHRHTQGCSATKQVQRADEDPTLFEVTYHGTHTCVDKAATAAAAVVSKAQPEQNPDAQSFLQSLSASLTVKTEGLTAEPQQGWGADTPFCFTSPVTGLAPLEHYPFSTLSTPENCFGQGVSSLSLSPSLEPSPATSDSMAPFHAEGRAQAELQELVSALALAATASTTVPAVVTDFSVDGFELYPDLDFTIDVSSFFP